MKINTNGQHVLPSPLLGTASGSTVVLVSGSPGAALMTICYQDDDGVFVPLLNGAVSAGTQYLVTHGIGVTIYAVVTGSDPTTNFNITLANKL
jgi:hypothetical protein